jgi:hypothetical protein
MASEYAELVALFPQIRAFMAECGTCMLAGMRPPVADSRGLANPEVECFELVGLDLMIERSVAATSSPRVWLLEVNSFPAAAPFHQDHGKSVAFHREQVGFCASLLSVVLNNRGKLLGGDVGSPTEMGKWRIVAS